MGQATRWSIDASFLANCLVCNVQKRFLVKDSLEFECFNQKTDNSYQTKANPAQIEVRKIRFNPRFVFAWKTYLAANLQEWNPL